MISFFRKPVVFVLGAALLAAAVWGVLNVTSVTAAESALSPAQREEISKLIHDYIMENPSVVMDALTAHQQNEREGELKKFGQIFAEKKDTILNGGSPFAGNPEGDVTIVEFFDYSCGYCKRAVDDITGILEKDKNVKIIFKDFPILSEASNLAAKWALAAHKQGKYFDFHVALMKHKGTYDDAALGEIAKSLGLDADQLRKDAQDPEIAGMLEADRQLAQDLGIRGTPGFIIGDTLSPGYIGLDAMLQMVDDMRKNKPAQ